MSVRFFPVEDGTELTVDPEKIAVDETGHIVGFRLEIVAGSAAGPGAHPLPTSGADFVELFGNPYTGSPQYIQNLSDLFA